MVGNIILKKRYFPASPVQNSTSPGSAVNNGGCESYVELAKALNVLGNSQVSTAVTASRWCATPGRMNYVSGPHAILQEFDYDTALVGYKAGGGAVYALPGGGALYGTTCAAGDLGSACFGIATDLETSNGLEISGLNAEEQSDISLIARWSAAQGSTSATSSENFNPTQLQTSTGVLMDVFTYIDSMIVLRENNVLELIQ